MSSQEVTVPETKKEIRGAVSVVSVDQIDPNPWNPNKQTDFIFQKEKVSIHENGFLVPCLVREKNGRYEIIDGEHRWKAAKELGYTEISINNMGEVKDEDAKKLTIIMNETRGKADFALMGKLLKDLSETIPMEQLAYSLPYTPMEIETMIVEQQVDWDNVGGDVSGGGAGAPGTGENKKLSISLPESTHQAFMDLIDQVNAKLFPESEPSDCEPAEAIAAICAVMNQIDLDTYLKT